MNQDQYLTSMQVVDTLGALPNVDFIELFRSIMFLYRYKFYSTKNNQPISI